MIRSLSVGRQGLWVRNQRKKGIRAKPAIQVIKTSRAGGTVEIRSVAELRAHIEKTLGSFKRCKDAATVYRDVTEGKICIWDAPEAFKDQGFLLSTPIFLDVSGKRWSAALRMEVTDHVSDGGRVVVKYWVTFGVVGEVTVEEGEVRAVLDRFFTRKIKAMIERASDLEGEIHYIIGVTNQYGELVVPPDLTRQYYVGDVERGGFDHKSALDTVAVLRFFLEFDAEQRRQLQTVIEKQLEVLRLVNEV